MDGILAKTESNVKIMIVMLNIRMNENQHVAMVTIVKLVTVCFYIHIRVLRNVSCMKCAKNGIVQSYIHILGPNRVLIKKTVKIQFARVYIHQIHVQMGIRMKRNQWTLTLSCLIPAMIRPNLLLCSAYFSSLV